MAFVTEHDLFLVLHHPVPVALAEGDPLVLHGWVRRGLGAIFLEGSFSFARQILLMVLMEMFSRAGNRPSAA
jgi:hypothetical protein